LKARMRSIAARLAKEGFFYRLWGQAMLFSLNALAFLTMAGNTGWKPMLH
jgi:hypothetical protein